MILRFVLFLILIRNAVLNENDDAATEYSDTNKYSNDNSNIELLNVVSDVNKTLTVDRVKLTKTGPNDSSLIENQLKNTVKCKKTNMYGFLELVSASDLEDFIKTYPESSDSEEGDCVLVFFYDKSCRFSSLTAPHFNALSRSFPYIKMIAVDVVKSYKLSLFEKQYDLVDVPILKMFFNGESIADYSGLEYSIESFNKFVKSLTGQDFQVSSITTKDLQGPVMKSMEYKLDAHEDYGLTAESEVDIPNVDDSESLLSNVVSDVNKTLINLYNQVTSANISIENKTQAENETRKLVKCKKIAYESADVEASVDIINGSVLVKLLQIKSEIVSRDMEADCVLVMFYARSCPFSAHAAPHFNALARSYPNIKLVAVDSMKNHGVNALYGIVGVPTLKMFHNGRSVGKYNGTEYNIHSFSKFINTITGQNPQSLLVTSKDFQGPISSVLEKETDSFLIMSWLFIAVCAIYYFLQSRYWTMIVEIVQNNWRESAAQHEHND